MGKRDKTSPLQLRQPKHMKHVLKYDEILAVKEK